jgi:hypothetical protein
LSLQNQVAERENDKKIVGGVGKFSFCFSGVQSGLAFILRHCSEPLFPRKVSTAATRREQKPVTDRAHAMTYFQGSLWEDCRIAAFGIGQKNPDLIFIELDAADFVSMRSFKSALTKILNRIETKIGGHPTVIWSGRGYHIIQPIHCPIPLEDIKELAALEPYTSNKFLQFAECYLSANKQDKTHYPALKSCLLRIPGSYNSKCKVAGVDAEVKIIQRWDGHRPDYWLLLGSFYAYLVGRQRERQISCKTLLPDDDSKGEVIPWIEKLLQTPIEDYRKHARDLIIIPYLVVRRGMTDETQILDIVMQWADKCGELRRLEPSRREFVVKARSRIYQVMRDRISQMKLATLKEKNPDLYEILRVEEDSRYRVGKIHLNK